MSAKSLREQLSKLIAEYGSDHVLEEVQRLTKSNRGRPKISDWDQLEAAMEADALDIINRRDPLKERNNTFTAMQLVRGVPQHSVDSALRRIRSKLSEHRVLYATVFAAVMSTYMAPYRRHLEIVDDLINLESPSIWIGWRTKRLVEVEAYQAATGLPLEATTMAEIMGWNAAQSSPRPTGYGIGSFDQRKR